MKKSISYAQWLKYLDEINLNNISEFDFLKHYTFDGDTLIKNKLISKVCNEVSQHVNRCSSKMVKDLNYILELNDFDYLSVRMRRFKNDLGKLVLFAELQFVDNINKQSMYNFYSKHVTEVYNSLLKLIKDNMESIGSSLLEDTYYTLIKMKTLISDDWRVYGELCEN